MPMRANRVGPPRSASVANNPKTDAPLAVYADDVGAFNYAITMPDGKWAGSYHGGERVNTMTVKVDGNVVDPTTSTVTGTSFRQDYNSSVVSDSDGYPWPYSVATLATWHGQKKGPEYIKLGKASSTRLSR